MSMRRFTPKAEVSTKSPQSLVGQLLDERKQCCSWQSEQEEEEDVDWRGEEEHQKEVQEASADEEEVAPEAEEEEEEEQAGVLAPKSRWLLIRNTPRVLDGLMANAADLIIGISDRDIMLQLAQRLLYMKSCSS